MCRFLAVRGATEAVAEFLRGPTVEVFQQRSYRHNAGWGIGWYEDGSPRLMRKPVWARKDTEFLPTLREIRSPTVMLHVRRATRGRITVENTHPFSRGKWTFSHNGTIVNRVTRLAREWLQPDTEGDTDSEVFFYVLMHFIEREGDVVEGVRAAVQWVIGISQSARLNFVLSDGDRIYAYRRGHTLYHFALTLPTGTVEGVSSDALGIPSRSIGRDWMAILDGVPSHDSVARIRLDTAVSEETAPAPPQTRAPALGPLW